VFILIGNFAKEIQLGRNIPEIWMSEDSQGVWAVARIMLKHLHDQIIGIELVIVQSKIIRTESVLFDIQITT